MQQVAVRCQSKLHYILGQLEVQYELKLLRTFGTYTVVYRSQSTQTTYLLSQGGLRRPIVDPARHATFLQ